MRRWIPVVLCGCLAAPEVGEGRGELPPTPVLSLFVGPRDALGQVELVVSATETPLVGTRLQVWAGAERVCDFVPRSVGESCLWNPVPEGGAFTITVAVRWPDGRVAELGRALSVPAMRAPVLEIEGPAHLPVESPYLNLDVSDAIDVAAAVTVRSSVDGAVFEGVLSLPFNDRLELPALTPGPHVLTAVVVNERGLSTMARWSGWVAEGPETPELVPLPVEITSETSYKAALAAWPQHPEGRPVAIDWRWRGNAVGSVGSSLLSSLRTRRGESWILTVTARDPVGVTSSSTRALSIVNSPPRIERIGVVQGGFRCEVEGIDADGDTLEQTLSWYDPQGQLLGMGADRPVGEGTLRCVGEVEDGHGGVASAWVDAPPGLDTPALLATVVAEDSYGVELQPSWLEAQETTWWVDGEQVSSAETLDAGEAPAHGRIRACVTAAGRGIAARFCSSAYQVPSPSLVAPLAEVVPLETGSPRYRCAVTPQDPDERLQVEVGWGDGWVGPFGDDVAYGGDDRWQVWPGDLPDDRSDPALACVARVSDGFATATGRSPRLEVELCDDDRDGALSTACGGDDCDDHDRDRYPGAPESAGDPDLNCDGLRCATHTLPEGEVVALCTEPLTKEEARERCLGAGYDGLMSLPGSSRLLELREVGVLPAPVWLGLEVQEGVWTWSGGAPLVYDRWREPVQEGAAAWLAADGWWDRVQPEDSAGFVCER